MSQTGLRRASPEVKIAGPQNLTPAPKRAVWTMAVMFQMGENTTASYSPRKNVRHHHHFEPTADRPAVYERAGSPVSFAEREWNTWRRRDRITREGVGRRSRILLTR